MTPGEKKSPTEPFPTAFQLAGIAAATQNTSRRLLDLRDRIAEEAYTAASNGHFEVEVQFEGGFLRVVDPDGGVRFIPTAGMHVLVTEIELAGFEVSLRLIQQSPVVAAIRLSWAHETRDEMNVLYPRMTEHLVNELRREPRYHMCPAPRKPRVWDSAPEEVDHAE